MSKKIVSTLMALVMALSLLPVQVLAAGLDYTTDEDAALRLLAAPADITGTGTENDPYLIYTAEELKLFRDIVNGSNGQTQNIHAHAKLMNDIVLNDGTFDEDGNYTKGASGADAEKWTPIVGYYGYRGTFDGSGHTIRGLYVKDGEYAGLFGFVYQGAVKNVTVTGYVEGTQYVGGIAGYINSATISGCTNAATVKAKRDDRFIDVGGIVGRLFNNGNVRSCTNSGSVWAQIDSDQGEARVGGIAGYLQENATIADCYNAGSIAIEDGGTGEHGIPYLDLGGIVGSATRAVEPGYISNCYSVGSLTYRGSASAEIRGIAGDATRCFVTNCYWLEGTAESGIGGDPMSSSYAAAKSKADFANGTVLALLKGDRTDSPWDKCGYVEDADMTLPLLDWQVRNARKYDICITGKQITSLNRNDVLGDGKVSFVYDDVNKKGTLTLDGVNIVCNGISDDYPIYAPDIENLEIVLKGENKIEAEWVACIMADNLTFSGDGSIEISTDGYSNWPVSCDRAFTVNGGNVKISSIDYALCLDGALTVNGGTLELIASDDYGYAIDIGRNDLNVVLADDRIMITGTNPDGSDAQETDVSEKDTIKAARYVKILSKYIPIVYEPGQYGTGSAVTQNKTYGEDFNLAGALFTRTGYQQIGWALSDGGDKAYELGAAYTGNEPLTLYPVWEAEQYSITCDPNGGTIGSGHVTGYTYGVGATLPTDVTRTGYTFDGWYDNAALEGTAVTSISDTDSGNKTYYAKWTEKSNYIVIFISNGGTLATDKKTVKWTDKVLDGVADPTRNGYDFAGWKYVDTEVTADTTYADLAVNDTVASVTLAAQWRDAAAPTGEIRVAGNGWKTFLHNITFELFFKDAQTVTVTAADNSGEAVTIAYLLSDKALTEAELAGMTFTAYSAPFTIDPDDEYVIYARLTDTSGNAAYINTNGIVLDAAVPVISGIENGKTYCAAQTVTVTEKYIDTVTVNGTEISLNGNGQFTLSPASGGQTMVVTDKAGNETRVTVTVNDGHTGGTATCVSAAVCTVCGQTYGSKDAGNHDLKRTAAKEPGVFVSGHIEYWRCSACGKYFADANGAKEISKSDTIIPRRRRTADSEGGKASPATFDAGIGICAVTAVTSLAGLTLLRRKRRDSE